MRHTSPPAADEAASAAEKPPSDCQAESLLRLIHWTSAAGRQLRRRLAEVAATFDLSDTELLVVWLCSGNGRVQIDLAGAIGVSASQMSGLAERLRSRGLVAMHRPALDRRRQVWLTAPAGQSLLAHVARHLETIATAVDGTLTPAEQQLAESLCERLSEAVNTAPKRPSVKAPAALSESGSSQEAA